MTGQDARSIGVGDLVQPWGRELDPREVAKVEGDQIWLYLLTNIPAGPFPLDNYEVVRKAGAR